MRAWPHNVPCAGIRGGFPGRLSALSGEKTFLSASRSLPSSQEMSFLKVPGPRWRVQVPPERWLTMARTSVLLQMREQKAVKPETGLVAA